MIRNLAHIFCALLLTTLLNISPALAAGKGVVLNFSEVDISTMVKFISDLTGRNFVLDDRVKGKISVFSPAKLSNEEAYNVFVSVLELKGFTVVQSGKVAKIVPSASARQAGFTLLPPGEQVPVNENYVAQVTKLENITAQEALTFLQPMVSKDGHISAFAPGNLILMVDSALNIRKLQGILQTIDSERTRDGMEVVYLKNASAENAASTIRQWLGGTLDGKQSGPAAGSGASAGGSVMADQRLNALLLFGTDSVKKSIREMVAKLDVASPEASSKVNVYYLENTDATEMAKVLDGVVKGAASAAPAQAGQQGGAAPQASPFESGRITITPDKASNSLVIMASPNDYSNLAQVIKKLDRRSKQVFVQVLIAEVSLDRSREVGLQSGVIGGAALNKYLAVAGLYDPLGTFSSVLGSLNGVVGSNSATASLLNSFEARPANMAAVLKAMDRDGLVNVLSTPNILTTDNKEAEIFVGENVPFSGQSTISSGVSTTSVDRKDIGINLKLKPQISEGDYIRLDINQEISDVKDTVTVGSGLTDRTTTKRSAKTSIVIKDKESVVIGGLIQDKEDVAVQKIPFLGDIPGLGWLFKTKTKVRKKTNLMILLTPRIVKDASDLADVSDSQRQKFGSAVEKSDSVNAAGAVGKGNGAK